MITGNSPQNGASDFVEIQLGEAYKTVKLVADNLDLVATVGESLEVFDAGIVGINGALTAAQAAETAAEASATAAAASAYAASIESVVLRNNLANTAVAKGASMIGTTDEANAQLALNARAKSAELASMVAGKGAALIGTTLGITGEKLNSGLVVSAPWVNANGTASDDSGAINAYLASNTRLHFPTRIGNNSNSRYGLSAPINIVQSNTHLSFDNGARIIPVTGVAAPAQMIDIRGAAPTSWTALSRDAYAHSNLIRTATDPGWQVGDWIEVRSSKIIDTSVNYCSDMQGECHRIAMRYGGGPYDFVFDTSLIDTYLIAEGATAGKATMLENIVIERPQFNDEEFGSNIMNFSIRAEYCAGLKIISPRGYGSKTPLGNDRANGDFIKLINCIDPYIEDPRMMHGAYYGLSVSGWTRHLRSYGGDMTDVRHAVSVVQKTQKPLWEPVGRVQEYGQPFDILIHGMTARNTSLSGFDTHDTGLHIRFESCTSYGAGDDGFQFRSPKVKAVDCVAYGSHIDGFSHNDMISSSDIAEAVALGLTPPTDNLGAADCELINCRAIGNGRAGVNFPLNTGIIRGGEYSFNGTIASRPDVNLGSTLTNPPILPPILLNQNVIQEGACGVRMNGGVIEGATIVGNAGSSGANGSAISYGSTSASVTMRPLVIRDVIAPADAIQNRFISVGSSSLNFGLVTLAGGNQIDGYGDRLFDNFAVVDNIAPFSLGGSHITTTAAHRSGQGTLVGGSVFVPNTGVRNKLADAAGEAIVSKITLTRMMALGVPGSLYVKSIQDGVGFTVASTSYAEPTRTNVVRNNTNVGVTNGVIGSGGVLPTNWTVINVPSGLATEIIGTGTEAVLGGGTQNYIDIKVSGTAGAAGTLAINFDTITNPSAATSDGETWSASFGAKLAAGAMTGLAPRAALISYTSGGAAITAFFNAITIGANHARYSQTARVVNNPPLPDVPIQTVAFARAVMQLVVTNGAVINATFRIYMPQLEKAADASAPIATTGSAATRTQDPNASDNSTFEWTASV